MRAKDFITGTNIMFLLAAIYFIAIAGLGEGSVYSAIGGVLCLIALGFSARKEVWVAATWRMATAAFSLVIFISQLIANFSSKGVSNVYSVSSTLLSGGFFILFVGVMLSTSRDIVRKSSEEETEEETKESKKLTYEI